MENVISFIQTYLPIIIPCLMLLLSFITVFLSKKNNKVVVLKELLEALPDFIKDAEAKGFIDGQSKLNYVCTLCVVKLATSLNKSVADINKLYRDLIIGYVEKILSTPQKKEDK